LRVSSPRNGNNATPTTDPVATLNLPDATHQLKSFLYSTMDEEIKGIEEALPLPKIARMGH
jgi:hypothetical protein